MQNIQKLVTDTEKKGRIFVISAPSGAGKTTLCQRIIEEVPRATYSVSVTSRPPRSGEKSGKDYIFLDKEEFKKRIEEGYFLEWAVVHGHYYGTSQAYVSGKLSEGRLVVLDLDVQGALSVKEKIPGAVLIFIMPPDMKELERRLRERKQDTDSEIKKRLQNSSEEIERLPEYDYLIVNDDLEDSLKKLKSIITAQECKL